MSRRRSFLTLLLACALRGALPHSARGDGFGFYAQGGCATSLGGAFVGRACPADPSSLFYNPAALALVPGTRLSLGLNLVFNASRYEFPDPADSRATVGVRDRNETFAVPHLFVSRQVDPRITVGLGICLPYGLGSEWPVDPTNPGRFVAYNAEILGLYAQPTVAVRLSPEFSVGLGFDVVYAWADVARLMDPNEIPGLEGVLPPGRYAAADAGVAVNGWGTGFNVAVLVEPTDRWTFGLRYLSQVTVGLEGDVTLAQVPLADQGAPDGELLDALVAAALPPEPLPGRSRVTFPDQVVAGVEVRPWPLWTFAFVYQWTNWSDFDTLVVSAPGFPPDTAAPAYRNASTFRLGAAYEWRPSLTLRAGLVHDPTPADPRRPYGVSVLLPDATRTNVSLGLGWRLGPRLQADLYWLGVFFRDTEGCVVPASTSACALPASRYASNAHLLGVTVGYGF